jgi:hypothetical protein
MELAKQRNAPSFPLVPPRFGRNWGVRKRGLLNLAAMKRIWGDRLTTVWPRQGHYALDRKAIATYPSADITIERIDDLFNYGLPAILGAFKASHAQ